MSKELIGRSSEDLQLLAMELAEVKEILRETSQQIRRIERRVKAALPRSEGMARQKRKTHPTPLIDDQAARVLVERLKERIRNGDQIDAELHGYLVKNELKAIAKILGMTNTKLPPKDDLVLRISTRLRQGVLVSSGIDSNNKMSEKGSPSAS